MFVLNVFKAILSLSLFFKSYLIKIFKWFPFAQQ